MATPAQLREDVTDVTADALSAYRDLLAGATEAEAYDVLRSEVPGLIHLYGETAAVVAAEWYDEARSVAGVGGSFLAHPATLPEVGMDGLIGWAAAQAQSFPSMLALIEGGVQRQVANGARITVLDSSARDSRSIGTQRYARTSGGCAFCRMLAGRGAVYRSEDSATFSAHRNCHCVAVPAFQGAPLPVKPYTPSTANITDADRARVRAWLRTH